MQRTFISLTCANWALLSSDRQVPRYPQTAALISASSLALSLPRAIAAPANMFRCSAAFCVSYQHNNQHNNQHWRSQILAAVRRQLDQNIQASKITHGLIRLSTLPVRCFWTCFNWTGLRFECTVMLKDKYLTKGHPVTILTRG